MSRTGDRRRFKETGLHAFFRRDKQEPEPALPYPRLDPAAPVGSSMPVQAAAGMPRCIERVHLVFHEREERGDDDGKAAEVQRRHW